MQFNIHILKQENLLAKDVQGKRSIIRVLQHPCVCSVLLHRLTIMLNNSILLLLFLFIAGSASMPANDTDDYPVGRMQKRDVGKKIDGSVHQIKGSSVNYQQRLQGEQCFVDYQGKLLAENEVMQIQKKMYRVEDCLLERVFHGCGPKLIYMLHIVCRVVEQHAVPRAVASDSSGSKATRMISESCCQDVCNISELTRYCHTD